MRVISFGEIMLRLAPEGYNRFVQASGFQAAPGGSEANVAVSLANFGVDAAFVTKLPAHEIGQLLVNGLRAFGVDTRLIVRGGERAGLYFCEKGASQRPSKVLYDRAGSAIATADRSDFDWAGILSGADWFHFSGITPALGGNLEAILRDALEAAKKAGCTVSCDLNYRKNLWSLERAGQVMTGLMPFVDVLIANEGQAADLFGIRAAENGAGERAAYESVARQLAARFGFQKVGITLRESLSASDNLWAGMLLDGGECHFSRKYALHIVDRVGGGDSFAAGLIYACLSGYEPLRAIEFAVAAGALKHSVEGDFGHASLDEVRVLADGDGSGRVLR